MGPYGMATVVRTRQDITQWEGYGAMYTNPKVVNMIRDLVGYSPGKPLHQCRLREPSGEDGTILNHDGVREQAQTRLEDSAPGIETHPLPSTEHQSERFDLVVELPPYVRQELSTPDKMMLDYQQYATMCDRADLYVPCIEYGPKVLNPGERSGVSSSTEFQL